MYDIGISEILLNVDKWNNENVIEFESSNKDELEILESWKSGVTFPTIMSILIKVDNYIVNMITFMAKLSDGNIIYKDTTVNN